MDNGHNQRAGPSLQIPEGQTLVQRPNETNWNIYTASGTIRGRTITNSEYPNHVIHWDTSDGCRYLHPKNEIVDVKLHRSPMSIHTKMRDGHVMSAERSSQVPKGSMFRSPGETTWRTFLGSAFIHGPTTLSTDHPNHVIQATRDGWEYLHLKDEIKDATLHANPESVRIHTHEGHVDSAELSSQSPIGQSRFRRVGDTTWSEYYGSSSIHGPTALNNAYANHVMQTASDGSYEYLHLKDEIKDATLHENPESVRIQTHEGHVASAGLSSKIPIGQTMVRRPNETTWDIYTGSDAIHGRTTTESDSDHVTQLDSSDGYEYMHPKNAIVDVDLHLNPESVRIQMHGGHVQSAEPSSHIPIGRSMVQRPWETTWNNYRASESIDGPTALNPAYPNHVLHTDHGSGWRYLHPRDAITNANLHENPESIRIQTRDGHVQSAELSSGPEVNEAEREAVRQSLDGGKILKAAQRSDGSTYWLVPELKSEFIKIAGRTADDIYYRQILPESGTSGSSNFIAAGTLSSDLYRFRPPAMTPPKNTSDFVDGARMYISIGDNGTVETLETEIQRASRLEKPTSSDVIARALESQSATSPPTPLRDPKSNDVVTQSDVIAQASQPEVIIVPNETSPDQPLDSLPKSSKSHRTLKRLTHALLPSPTRPTEPMKGAAKITKDTLNIARDGPEPATGRLKKIATKFRNLIGRTR